MTGGQKVSKSCSSERHMNRGTVANQTVATFLMLVSPHASNNTDVYKKAVLYVRLTVGYPTEVQKEGEPGNKIIGQKNIIHTRRCCCQ